MEPKNEEEKPVSLDISSLDTLILLRFFISILSEKAWQNMGLRIKPGTEEVEKDLEKAKIAIDTIEYIIKSLELKITEDEKKSLKNLLADLQINFVRQST